MSLDPYRTPAPKEPPEVDASPAFSVDDAVAKSVFFVVGSLGVIAGIVSPKCSLELSLGLLTLFFVARWSLSDRRRGGPHR